MSNNNKGSRVSRNLTNSYLKYRGEYKKKKNRFQTSFLTNENQEKRTLGPNSRRGNYQGLRSSETGSMIEMDSLPPQWVDVVDEANENIATLKDKLQQLNKAQQKRMRQVFSDGNSDKPDREIEVLQASIGALFKKSEAHVRLIQTQGADMGMSNKDYALRQNVQRSLATQVQDCSTKFRKLQKHFMEALRKRSADPNAVWDDEMNAGGGILSADSKIGLNENHMVELEEMELNVDHRNEEIRRIAESVTELHQIFKEMSVLVIDQGTMLDRIDYNVEQVVTQSREANQQLETAERTKKEGRAKQCINWLIFGISINILLLYLRYAY